MSSREVWLAVLGAAVAGGLCAGEIESITFTGKQYVMTDVVPTTNMCVVCDFELLEAPQGSGLAGIIGSLAQTPEGANAGWGLRAHGPNNKGVGDWDGKYIGWSGHDAVKCGPVTTGRHRIELASGRVVLDGVTNVCAAAHDPSEVKYAMRGYCIGDAGWGNGDACARMRFFSLKIYQPVDGVDTLTHDFVPYLLDGIYGVYDKKTSKFACEIGSQGIVSGVWTRRPSVTPTAWNRRTGANPVIDMGEAAEGVTVACSHTAQQLAALPLGSHRITFTTSSADPASDGLVVTEVVTVSEPLVGSVSADGTRLSLTFPPAPEARTLHLAYGQSDHGDNLSDWEHVDEVPVAAGVDALTVDVPAGFGAENPVWCAFLKEPSTAKSALSYVRHDNLIMQFDGVENAAYGTHTDGLSCPVEIRRGLAVTPTGSFDCGARSFEINQADAYFTLHSQVLKDTLNLGRATVELVLADAARPPQTNGGLFCQGLNQRGIWIYQAQNQMLAAMSYHATAAGQYEDFPVGSGGRTNLFSVVLNTTKETSYLMVNGARRAKTYSSRDKDDRTQTITRFETDVQDDSLMVGRLFYNNGNFYARAKYFSIRVYNQPLSAADLAANYAVDKARFTGTGLEKVGPFYYPDLPLKVLDIHKTDRLPTSADLSFTGAAKPRRLYILWGAKDGGADWRDWEGEPGEKMAYITSIPAGVTRYTVNIPVAAQTNIVAKGGFRFLLENVVSAESYVQPDHLIAQFDGIENAGFGVHDAKRATPVELRHNSAITASGTMTADEKSFTMGSQYFHFQSTKLKDALNAGHATVELVLSTNVNQIANGGYFAIGENGQQRGLWLYQRAETSRFFGDMSYHAVASGQYDGYSLAASACLTNTLSFVLGQDTAHSYLALNNVKVTRSLGSRSPMDDHITRFSTDVASDKVYVGWLPGYQKAIAKAFSIRVYDCVLTEEELETNVKIDAHRFRDEFAYYTVSDYTRATPQRTVFIVR